MLFHVGPKTSKMAQVLAPRVMCRVRVRVRVRLELEHKVGGFDRVGEG